MSLCSKRGVSVDCPRRTGKDAKRPIAFESASARTRRELPYSTQLVPLAAALARLGDRWLEPRIYDKLARWFWSGILGELYGGAVETRMANDYEELLRQDAFEDVLEDRRRHLCRLIGTAMGKAVAQTAEGGSYEEHDD